MGSRSYMWVIGYQFFWCFGVTLLLIREDVVLSAHDANGVAVRHLQCPGLQPDGLTGWSPLMVNNATLYSQKLPIRKTAETQRGETNQCVTGSTFLNVKYT